MVQIERRQSIVLHRPERSGQFDDEGGEVTDQIFLDLKDVCGDDRELFEELDTDGDGKLSHEELVQCIRAKKASEKGRKVLRWWLGAAVVVYVITLVAFGGILHLQLQANKDTELASSGTMMVKNKHTDGVDLRPLEVSMKSHGEVFTPTNSIIDATGTEKVCINDETVRKMFVSATKGTNAKFMQTDSTTGKVVVLEMAGNTCPTTDGSPNHAASWNNEEIQLGSMVLVPSMECTEAASDGRRSLSRSDLMEHHRMLRDHTIHTHILGKDGGDVNDDTSMNAMGRRLKEAKPLNFSLKSTGGGSSGSQKSTDAGAEENVDVDSNPMDASTYQQTFRGFETDVVGGIKGTLSYHQDDVSSSKLGQSCGYTNQKSTGSYMSTYTVCAENIGFNVVGSDCGACYRVHYQKGTTDVGGDTGGASTNTVIMVANEGGNNYRQGENDFDCYNSAYRKIVTTKKQTWWDITYEPVDCDTGGNDPTVSIEEANFDGGSGKKINYLKLIPYNLPTAVKDMYIVIGGKSTKLQRNGKQGVFVQYEPLSSGGNASFTMILKDGRTKTVNCNKKGRDLSAGSFCSGVYMYSV